MSDMLVIDKRWYRATLAAGIALVVLALLLSVTAWKLADRNKALQADLDTFYSLNYVLHYEAMADELERCQAGTPADR